VSLWELGARVDRPFDDLAFDLGLSLSVSVHPAASPPSACANVAPFLPTPIQIAAISSSLVSLSAAGIRPVDRLFLGWINPMVGTLETVTSLVQSLHSVAASEGDGYAAKQ
jgi:hypothetical protein